MKTFNSLSHAERTKINKFHSIHYDMNILDAAVKQLISNPDPDFICCLSAKFSYFIEQEVLPLSERHCIDMRTTHDANLASDLITKTIAEDETENTENSKKSMADN